jgi:hypothetical protein
VVRPVFEGGNIAAAVGVLVGLSSFSSSGCVGNDIPPRPIEAPDLASCDAGPCPTALVSAPGCVAIDLVVADDTLFWTNRHAGTVNSVPTMGGPIKVLAGGQSSPGPLAVDGTSIFWVAGNKTIMKKPLAAGPATVFVPATTVREVTGSENDVNALLVDQGTLYFGRFTAALKVSTSGGTPTMIGLSPDLGKPAAFAIDATHLYQTERDHMAVSREALDGTQDGLLGNGDPVTREHLAPDRIAVSQGTLLLEAIAVANGNVIWANYNAIDSKPVDALEHDPLFSIAETQLDGNVTGFVVSDDTIFLGDAAFTKGNVVEKVPLPAADAGAPATPVVIATDQLSPSQFAADATNVYWRTADCKIMRLAK